MLCTVFKVAFRISHSCNFLQTLQRIRLVIGSVQQADK